MAIKSYGDRIAIEGARSSWNLTYSALGTAADSVFAELAVPKRTVLVLYLDKSPEYYAALAACFLFGLNFCPVDTQNPIGRLIAVAEQFPDYIILTSDCSLHVKLGQLGQPVRLIRLPDVPMAFIGLEEHTQEVSATPAYYIATSGSSGIPKLVAVPHDNAIDFIDWAIPFYKIDEETRWAGFSSIGFDLSLVDFLPVLCGGGTLISLATRFDRSRLGLAIANSRITHWHSVPSVICYILADNTPDTAHCRLFTFCGEPLNVVDVEALSVRFPNARIINTYGPTETTLFCSFYEYDADAAYCSSSLPVGSPIPGWNFVYLPQVDGASRLLIISRNVANGYVGILSEKFAQIHVFGESVKLFDTGDYFLRVGDNVYFSHRRDGMVKIRGNRVDLGEVEAACKRLGLTNPIAIVNAGSLTVVAEGMLVDEQVLRAKLAGLLPSYCVPSAFRSVTEHPRTISGKINRELVKLAEQGIEPDNS